MPSGPQLRAPVQQARHQLSEGRRKLKEQHQQGSPGIQVCARLTDLLDTVVLDIFQAALADLDQQGLTDLASDVTIVPYGGYGRRDVAPFSDVDLMLLHTPRAALRVVPLARRLVADLSDTGFDLGFSVRTPAHACSLSRSDPTVFTSLVESRYLAGSVKLFTGFVSRFRRDARRRTRRLMQSIRQARRVERQQYGETVFLLQPNVKRTRGGLRDLQMVRWIGFARYGEAELDSLQLRGVLSKQDQLTFRRAHEFLLRLRNELHFHAGRSQDVLGKTEQLRLAELYGFQGDRAVLPVEQFMQEYFRHTVAVRNTLAHFISAATPRSPIATSLAPFLGQRVERDFRVGLRHIRATKKSLPSIQSDVDQILRLMDLANQYNARIDPETWIAIRETMAGQTEIKITDEASLHFLSLLSEPARLGALLRRLHELGVLEKLVPGLSRARCLLQFNEYHKYTVDEHCIRAVVHATEFLNDPGHLGQAYRSMKRKRTLHLALILHDLGKGYEEDHSEVGRRLAEEAGRRLKLPQRETEKLIFLVHRHLVMAHLAFRRDTSDESVVVQFAVDVGTPDLLRMLYVLTCADLAAVGPGVLNQWKVEVLTELYLRAMQHLAGDIPSDFAEQQYRERREQIRALIHKLGHVDWYDRQIKALPPAYLQGTNASQIAAQLERLQQLRQDQAVAWARYLSDRDVVEYTVGTYEQIVPGIFHRLTGVLTSQGLEILSADIYTLEDGLVLDRFFVHDPDYVGEPSLTRMDHVRDYLVRAMTDSSSESPTFRRTWEAEHRDQATDLFPLPTRVLFDNNSSDRYTIIDIFANDRRGLLYTITNTLFDSRVSVAIAKIGTYVDQVVDVFYVTDQNGNKIEGERSLDQIRGRLLEAIEKTQSSTSSGP